MTTTRQPDGSTREIAMLVGILMLVVAGTVATYWVRSRSAEAAGPARAVAPAPAPAEGDVIHADVYFDFKSVRLRADGVRTLQEHASRMDRASTWGVLVQGFADRQGPSAYNRALAQQRAEAVKQFLVELGVAETAVRVVTIGPDGALCDDPGRECRQLDRRVHVEIRKLRAAAAAGAARPALASGDVLDTTSGQ